MIVVLPHNYHKQRYMKKSGAKREREAGEQYYAMNDIVAIWKYESDPEAQYIRKEQLERISQCVDNPDLKQRLKYLDLYYTHGYKYSELAELLGIGENDAINYISESLRLIKISLSRFK